MSESEKPRDDKPPESPTTARELDFDDDEVPTSPRLLKPADSAPASAPVAQTSKASSTPSQPPHPKDSREEAQTTLKEAFPSIDTSVIRAVLTASSWQVEPAFNALLGMSDPDAQAREPERAPPPQPPRPGSRSPNPERVSQMESDEMLARRLAEQYNTEYNAQSEYRQSRGQGQRGQYGQPRPARQPPQRPANEEEERNFFDDDLPEIRDNIKKGFVETQAKVNSFISNLMKKIDGEDGEETPPPQPPRRPTAGADYRRRSGEASRRSADYERYDADPQVLGDDFSQLHMQDNEAEPRRSGRGPANPDLFKPTPATPKDGRKVSFQEHPSQDDLYRSSPDPHKRPPTGKQSKWQPLHNVDPDPEINHDPFSVGDSEDEEAKKKDLKPNDSERLKSSASEASTKEPADTSKGLEEHEHSGSQGTRDKEAEQKLTGKA